MLDLYRGAGESGGGSFPVVHSTRGTQAGLLYRSAGGGRGTGQRQCPLAQRHREPVSCTLGSCDLCSADSVRSNSTYFPQNGSSSVHPSSRSCRAIAGSP
jgi:hypothetical protein